MQKFILILLLSLSFSLQAHTGHGYADANAFLAMLHQLFAMHHGAIGVLFILAITVALIVKKLNIKG